MKGRPAAGKTSGFGLCVGNEVGIFEAASFEIDQRKDAGAERSFHVVLSHVSKS